MHRAPFDRTGGAVRLGIALLMTALMLVGCSSGAEILPRPVSQGVSAAPSVEVSHGADVPSDDPSLKRVDADGRTPDQVVLDLVAAENRADWRTRYSLYASPNVDLATAQREWSESGETYEEFIVREVRVTGGDMAWVRVVYDATTAPPGGEPYHVRVEEPGEWWAVFKVGGRWKVQWMPRQ